MSLQKLNDLLSKFEIMNLPLGVTSKGEHSPTSISTLFFKGESTYKDNPLIKKLYNIDRNVQDTVGYTIFIDQIVKLIREKKKTNTIFTKNEYDSFFSSLLSTNISRYRILKDITGVSLEKTSKEPRFGPFKILHWPSKKGRIEKQYPQNPDVIWMGKEHEYLIQVYVNARDKGKAIEKAMMLFQMFESIFHVIIGNPNKRFFISIIDRRFTRYEGIYFFNDTDKTIGSSNTLYDYIEEVPVDHNYFKASNNIKVINYLFDDLKNDLKARITKSVVWLGQALRDINLVDGYLKAMISLEIVMQENVKGIITPSILHQISETAAIILGKTIDERLKIEKEIKELYSKRSSIAHAGGEDVDPKEYAKLCYYVRSILYRLILNKRYRCNTLQELFFIIKKEKYGNVWRKKNSMGI